MLIVGAIGFVSTAEGLVSVDVSGRARWVAPIAGQPLAVVGEDVLVGTPGEIRALALADGAPGASWTGWTPDLVLGDAGLEGGGDWRVLAVGQTRREICVRWARSARVLVYGGECCGGGRIAEPAAEGWLVLGRHGTTEQRADGAARACLRAAPMEPPQVGWQVTADGAGPPPDGSGSSPPP